MNMKIPILHYIIMREAFYSIDRETCEWDSFVVAVRHGWTLGEGERVPAISRSFERVAKCIGIELVSWRATHSRQQHACECEI